MFHLIYEYEKPWPKEGTMQLDAQFRGEIRISPDKAKQRAAGFMAGHITMMVLPGEPSLVLSNPPLWRVPVCLHLPDLGEVTTVGTIDVNALTGNVIMPEPEKIQLMQDRAHEIAARFASSPTTPG